jgi:hypothetical protein
MSNAIVVAIAVAVVGAVAAVSVHAWIAIGTVPISGLGWLALGLGVAATLAVGIGLMALVFISSRRGYDELPGGRNGGRRDPGKQPPEAS